MHEDFDLLLDDTAPADSADRVELPSDISVEAAADVLQALFAARGELHVVGVVLGGKLVGATSRGHIEPPGPARTGGTGDGATLPGHSSAYQLLRFTCPSCDAVVHRLHVDPAAPPTCPRQHGLLVPAP